MFTLFRANSVSISVGIRKTKPIEVGLAMNESMNARESLAVHPMEEVGIIIPCLRLLR